MYCLSRSLNHLHLKLGLFAWLWSVIAAAAAPPLLLEAPTAVFPFTIETIAESRIIENTSETERVEFVPAKQLQIGDEVFYTVRVRNPTDTAIRDVLIVKAVPRNILYVPNSAVGPAATITFSVDGGDSFAIPENLSVSALPGTARPAAPSDYTHIRWRLRHPLAAGATALLRFRGTFQ